MVLQFELKVDQTKKDTIFFTLSNQMIMCSLSKKNKSSRITISLDLLTIKIFYCFISLRYWLTDDCLKLKQEKELIVTDDGMAGVKISDF